MLRIVSQTRHLHFGARLVRSYRAAIPCLAMEEKNPEIYVGYNPDRKLEEVDVYALTSPNEPPQPTDYQLHGHREYVFENHFLSTSKGIHQIRQGGYVPVPDEDIATYLPGTLMGEVKEEFEFSETKAWMIRDPTKLLCRIIEEYEVNKSTVGPLCSDIGDEHGVVLRAHLPGLTDRPERNDAIMKVYRRGQLISGSSHPTHGNYEINSGVGSLVENTLDEIKRGDKLGNASLPTQILVTGKRFILWTIDI